MSFMYKCGKVPHIRLVGVAWVAVSSELEVTAFIQAHRSRRPCRLLKNSKVQTSRECSANTEDRGDQRARELETPGWKQDTGNKFAEKKQKKGDDHSKVVLNGIGPRKGEKQSKTTGLY